MVQQSFQILNLRRIFFHFVLAHEVVIKTVFISICVLHPVGSGGAEGSSGGTGKGGSSLALQPGDVVEVIEGDLMNLQGKVISVESDTVTIMPKHEDLKVRSGIIGSIGNYYTKSLYSLSDNKWVKHFPPVPTILMIPAAVYTLTHTHTYSPTHTHSPTHTKRERHPHIHNTHTHTPGPSRVPSKRAS